MITNMPVAAATSTAMRSQKFRQNDLSLPMSQPAVPPIKKSLESLSSSSEPHKSSIDSTSVISPKRLHYQHQYEQNEINSRASLHENDTDSILSSSTRSPRSSCNGIVAQNILKEDTFSLVSSSATDTTPSLNLTVASTPPPPSSEPPSPNPQQIRFPAHLSATRKSLNNGSTATPFGELQLQLTHIEDEQQIVVKILRARNLIARDANGYSDPYVKCYLLPGRE